MPSTPPCAQNRRNRASGWHEQRHCEDGMNVRLPGKFTRAHSRQVGQKSGNGPSLENKLSEQQISIQFQIFIPDGRVLYFEPSLFG
jgi:hypothetical protein